MSVDISVTDFRKERISNTRKFSENIEEILTVLRCVVAPQSENQKLNNVLYLNTNDSTGGCKMLLPFLVEPENIN